jgi:hypothetical protein
VVEGHSADLGLMIAEAFVPHRNIAVGGAILGLASQPRHAA